MKKPITLLILLALALTARAQNSLYDNEDTWRKAVPSAIARSSAFTLPKIDPALPNALLIGDSISIGYTNEVRNLLVRKMNVFRVPDNAQNTTHTLANIDTWLAGKKWDVIYCNWGLHDLTSRGPKPDAYAENLRLLIDKLRATGAAVVFATTTPIPPDNIGRLPGAELPYNAKALEVMREKNVLVSDLYAFALPRISLIQNPADVHFSSYGSAVLAQPVARAILNAHRGEKFSGYLKLK